MINCEIIFEGAGYGLLTEDNQRIGGFFVNVFATAQEPEQAGSLGFSMVRSLFA